MVTEYSALILGGIWMPYGAECSLSVKVSSFDVQHNGITDETVEDFIRLHDCGDFSSVYDMEITKSTRTDKDDRKGRIVTKIVRKIIRPWEHEDSEMRYLDTLPSEE